MEKKNLIIGGSIAAVVLIGASIGIGIAVSGGNNNYADEAIQTYSYKADASTTDKAFEFVGMSTTPEETIDKVLELTNTNSAFNEILEDKEMTDGVISNHGLGFGNSGIIGYTFTAGTANELVVFDDATTEADTSSLAAVLDINMKVPVSIADVLRGHLASEAATTLTTDDLNTAEAGYADVTMPNTDTQIDFAMSFGFFNYVNYSASAEQALSDEGFDTSGIEATATMSDAELVAWYEGTFGTGATPASGDIYSLNIDGSSTPDPAMTVIIDSFNSSTEWDFAITEELNNNGSGSAWAGSDADIPGGPAGSIENVGRTSTFLGTQSRNTGDFDDFADWGYAAPTNTVVNADGVEIADNSSFSTSGTILQTTMAVDSVSFFTAGDTEVLNPTTGEYETPTGITKDGIVSAYENGSTWNELAANGQIIFN